MISDHLVHFFELGLFKISSIIDGNDNYDSILGERLNNAVYNSIEKGGKISWDDAYHLLSKKLLKCKITFYHIDHKSRVLAYGSTYNNKREFNFLADVLSRNGYYKDVPNICDFLCTKTSIRTNEICNEILSVLDRFFLLRESVTKSILHQVLNYSLAFLGALASLRDSKAKLFVVANDHSPIPVAYAMVARFYGLKILYIQHAEITNIFPRNDFDYSILRNRASKNVYQKIGPFSGDVICLSRGGCSLTVNEIQASRQRLRENPSPQVVIYPSSVLLIEKLKSLLLSLKSDAELTDIKVKLHPGFKNIGFVTRLDVDIIDEIPKNPHLAICGNSSVVIELLSRGNLVYQDFNLDNISDDYYGFVKIGLAGRFSIEDRADKFWFEQREEDGWAIELGDYLPSLDTNFNSIEKERAGLFVRNMLFSSGVVNKLDYEVARKFYFCRDIFFITDSFLSLVRSKGCVYGDDFWMIQQLNAYFDTRDIRLNSLYKKVNLEICKSVLDFWILVKKIEWTGCHPSKENIENLIEFSNGYSGCRSTLSWIESKIFDILLRYSNVDVLDKFLEDARLFLISKSGINRKIAFIRYAQAASENSKFLLKHFDYSNMLLTPLERLKISVQCLLEKSGKLEYSDYQVVEQEFLRAHVPVAKEYRKKIMTAYAVIKNRTTLIDVKRNQHQEMKFIELIKSKLISRDGFSFIRLSDGEGYIFQEFSQYFTEDDACNRERHWWGREISLDVRKQLISCTLEAVKNADVLGIPSIYRFLRDQSDKSISLGSNIRGRGLLSVLKGVQEVDQGHALYTDDKANIAIFNKVENIRYLFQFAKKLILVSSGASEHLKKILGEELVFHLINVPTHNKTQFNEKYITCDKPLPYVFKDVCDEILEVAEAGDLVLVGAGVAGKVFMDAAKRKGAVGLDLGSAMDEFLNAGIHSLH